MADDATMAVCMRVEDFRGTVLAGSTQAVCDACPAPIWVSPSTSRVQGKVTLRCMPCAMATLRDVGSKAEMVVTKDQLGELASYFAAKQEED